MNGGDDATLSLQETISMQLDEMELLETAYPEVTFDTPDPRPLMRTALVEPLHGVGQDPPAPGEAKQGEELRLQAALAGIPLLSFRCPLSVQASLRVRLPRRYPEAPLLPTVDGTPQLEAGMRAAIQAAAVGEASRCSGELRREPHCLQVLGEAKLALIEFAERAGGVAVGDYGGATGAVKASRPLKTERAGSSNDAKCAHPSRTARCDHQAAGFVEGGWADTTGERRKDGRRGSDIGEGASGKGRSAELGSTTPGEVVGGADAFLGRRLIYSHHIIAQQKRTGIVATARELGLGGFSKVGWPGVIVVEGEEASCESFVKTLRGWRWKHLAVRGEELVRVRDGFTVDEERRLPQPLQELGEKEGVSALAKRCREAGLEELFSTLLR